MGAIMSGLVSLIGGEAAATGAAATVADTAGKAMKGASMTDAIEMGWQPKSYMQGMDFGIGNYSGTTDFAAGESGGVPLAVGNVDPQQEQLPGKADVGSRAPSPIAAAPGISAGSFGGPNMLGGVSMNAGLDGMLGKQNVDMIAASAGKFKNAPVSQVPGIRI